MRKVVRDRDASRISEDLKTSVNAGEGVQILRDLSGSRAEIVCSSRCCERIVDIVSAGNLQRDITELFTLVHQIEFLVGALDISEICGIVVVGLSEAKGDHRQGDVLDRVEDVLVVAVDDQCAGGQVTELVERFLDIVERLEVVEVIGVDVEDHGDIRIEFEEGVDIFARLAYDDIALTDIAVAADEGQLAADDRGGIEARADQRLAEHSGSGGLSVSTRDRDTAVISAGDDTEHHTALNGGDALFLCCNKLGIVGLDSGGIYDQLSSVDVLGSVTHVYLDAVALDALEGVALVTI